MRMPLVLSVAGRLASREPRRRDGARLAAVTVALWARGRLHRPGRRTKVTITAPNGVRVGLCVWTYIDMLVVREIFLDGEYRVDDRPVSSLLDLGSNVGVSVRYFRALYPEAEIVAVEPDPALIPRLRANVDGLERVRVVEGAVSARTGRLTFYATPAGWSSSLTPAAAGTPVDVRAITVAQLLAEVGRDAFDLVKVDIEGAEWDILADLAATTGCIVGELHHGEGRTVADAAATLAGWALDVHSSGDVSAFTATRH